VLHGESLCPYIDIIRHDDPDGDGYYWRNADGEPDEDEPYVPLLGMCSPQGTASPAGIVDIRTMRVPFPANGVIYADGNVRVRGILPPVRDMEGRIGAMIPANEVAEEYFGEWQAGANKGRSRRFDLQIVSGGTIYIEGDILAPRAAGLIPDTPEDDILYGTRLALLARDSVCVNTTALNPRPQDGFVQVLIDPDDPTQGYQYQIDEQPRYTTSGNWGYMLFQGPQDDPTNSAAGAIAWDGSPLPTDPADVSFDYTNTRLIAAHSGTPFPGDLAGGLADLGVMVGHGGWYVPQAQPGGVGVPAAPDEQPPVGATPSPPPPAPDEPEVRVSFSFGDGTTMSAGLWYWDGSEYVFRNEDELIGDSDESGQWYADPDPGQLDVDDNWLEHLPYANALLTPDRGPWSDWLTGRDVISFAATVSPVRYWEEEDDQWKVKHWQGPLPADGSLPWLRPMDLGYVLGPISIAPPNRDSGGQLVEDPLPVQIQALIYAQNGSWFVIPGRWFNDDPDEMIPNPLTEPTSPYPGYHEPLNIRVSVYGAISENLPADLGSVAAWTSKWGGPAGAGGQGFLSYAFDPLLRTPRRETADRIGHLRFPKFPLTSDLVIWGERITGPVGG
jgi:hypothetical protein